MINKIISRVIIPIIVYLPLLTLFFLCTSIHFTDMPVICKITTVAFIDYFYICVPLFIVGLITHIAQITLYLNGYKIKLEKKNQ